MSDYAPISPCVSICTMDPVSQLCRGCYRTIDEIASWSRLTPEAKRRIIAALPERYGRFDLGGPPPGQPRKLG